MFFKKKDPIQKLQDTAEEIKRTRYGRERYQVSLKARSGDHKAAVAMGRYWLGEGPNIDKKIAREYLLKAATDGNVEARIMYTVSLMDGMNDQGSSFSTWAALLNLAFLSARTYCREHYQWIIDEAEVEGNGLRAMVCVLDMSHGDNGVKISACRKIEGYALSGSPPAAAALAWCHFNGYGTTANYEEAYIWYSVAKSIGMNSVDAEIAEAEAKLPINKLPEIQVRAKALFEDVLDRIAAKHEAEQAITASIATS